MKMETADNQKEEAESEWEDEDARMLASSEEEEADNDGQRKCGVEFENEKQDEVVSPNHALVSLNEKEKSMEQAQKHRDEEESPQVEKMELPISSATGEKPTQQLATEEENEAPLLVKMDHDDEEPVVEEGKAQESVSVQHLEPNIFSDEQGSSNAESTEPGQALVQQRVVGGKESKESPSIEPNQYGVVNSILADSFVETPARLEQTGEAAESSVGLEQNDWSMMGRGSEKPASAIPEQLLEQFSRQLERLEENYQAEREETLKRHTAEVEELKNSFNHDACVLERKLLEEKMQADLSERDEQLNKLVRINEGYKLKLDALKREVAGTQQLLEARDSDIGKVNEEHLRSLRGLENKLRESEEKAARFKRETEDLKRSIESTNIEFKALDKEHMELKSRVKAIATELKDRRVECRELTSKIDDQNEVIEKLQEEVDNLRFKLSNTDRSRGEKDEQIESLHAKLADAAAELEKADKRALELQAQADKVLAEYKKKAQNSLALANSRAASAIQAKEEAELEARAARSTADTAMDRAVKAEISSKQSVAESKARVEAMEAERTQTLAAMEEAQQKLLLLQDDHQKTERNLTKALAINEQLSGELLKASADIREEQANVARLKIELSDSQAQVNKLRSDIEMIRGQLKHAESLSASESSPTKEEKAMLKNENPTKYRILDKGAVGMLQEELRDAKSTIEDLREALANAVALNERYEKAKGSTPSDETGKNDSHEANGESSNTQPFFYAVEKQAELNTARQEINRLANLLSNVQSEKQDALDLMEEMRHRTEAAEARLKRFEKLVSQTDANTFSHSNGSPKPLPGNSGAVNIEYLKNIMLSYLNAKSLSERKALVPVIGAVLCLTADEQKSAMRNLEESASLGNVGSSLFETLSSKLM